MQAKEENELLEFCRRFEFAIILRWVKDRIGILEKVKNMEESWLRGGDECECID